MKMILVPVDFSEFSLNAVKVAAYIARVKDLGISLLHVVEDVYTPYYNMSGINMIEDNSLISYRQEIQSSMQEKMEELAKGLRETGIFVNARTLIDSPHRTIINESNLEDVELIVMGSHGHSEIEDIFLGGTTERVIRSANKPVLSIHKIKDDFKINRIVFASDFKDKKTEQVLNRVIDLAEIFMAELFLVRINAPEKLSSEKEARKRLTEYAKNLNISAGSVTTYSDKTEEEGIVNYAKEINADLITMTTHGRTGLARLFKGSLAEEVAGFSDIPVLTYNISKDKVLESSRPAVKRNIIIRNTKEGKEEKQNE